MAGRIAPGVQAAPSEPALFNAWLQEIGTLAQHLQVVDHTA